MTLVDASPTLPGQAVYGWIQYLRICSQPVTRNCTNVGEGLGYRAFSNLPPGFPSVGSSELTAAQRSPAAPRSVLASAAPAAVLELASRLGLTDSASPSLF